MLPSVLVTNGRWLKRGALVGAALCFVSGVGLVGVWRVRELPAEASTIRAPWVETCAAKMDTARRALAETSPELERADVRQAWTLTSAWAELRLDPQYAARIELAPGDDAPSVFDWEETATPVAGSFALHRRVGHFNLTVVADDSDERGLVFAARMQPLLDACLMEAQ